MIEPRIIAEIDRFQCIFIHIPKTAGMSVSDWLYGGQIHHHRASEFDEYPEKYWRVTFVRNPYTRVLSGYNWYRKGGASESDQAWAEENVKPYPFATWVVERLQFHLDDHHFLPMSYWIDRPMTFIGRYGNLHQGVQYLRECLGVKKERFPCLNSSIPADMTEYSVDALKTVREIYDADFRAFRY